jgi:hypothetical protein
MRCRHDAVAPRPTSRCRLGAGPRAVAQAWGQSPLILTPDLTAAWGQNQGLPLVLIQRFSTAISCRTQRAAARRSIWHRYAAASAVAQNEYAPVPLSPLSSLRRTTGRAPTLLYETTAARCRAARRRAGPAEYLGVYLRCRVQRGHGVPLRGTPCPLRRISLRTPALAGCRECEGERLGVYGREGVRVRECEGEERESESVGGVSGRAPSRRRRRFWPKPQGHPDCGHLHPKSESESVRARSARAREMEGLGGSEAGRGRGKNPGRRGPQALTATDMRVSFLMLRLVTSRLVNVSWDVP